MRSIVTEKICDLCEHRNICSMAAVFRAHPNTEKIMCGPYGCPGDMEKAALKDVKRQAHLDRIRIAGQLR